jgi:dTDP-glucose 4,6-dehydratase/UDP-glucose 4-epimerase
VFGDGLQLRDFNFVDDCVEAMLLSGLKDEAIGKIYNLGSEEVINLKDLAARLISIVPERTYEIVPFPPERKAIDIGDYYSDFSLIRSELGWTPRVSLDEGLRKSVDYYYEFGQHYWS